VTGYPLSVASDGERQSEHLVFFFQAEDGIRGYKVTGVQTCALPISSGKLGQFALAYKTLNGKDPGAYSTEGYDDANILIGGIKEIGRASCRERVETTVVALTGKKQQKREPRRDQGQQRRTVLRAGVG